LHLQPKAHPEPRTRPCCPTSSLQGKGGEATLCSRHSTSTCTSSVPVGTSGKPSRLRISSRTQSTSTWCRRTQTHAFASPSRAGSRVIRISSRVSRRSPSQNSVSPDRAISHSSSTSSRLLEFLPKMSIKFARNSQSSLLYSFSHGGGRRAFVLFRLHGLKVLAWRGWRARCRGHRRGHLRR